MKILITGNLGYIGSVLTPLLEKEGYTVKGLDCGFYNDDLLCEQKEPSEQLIKDIRKVNETDIQDTKIIIHLAGLSNDPLGELDSNLTRDINYNSTVNLAKMAKRVGVEKFIYSSSQSMYGISQTSNELDEDESEKNPLTEYGKTKWESEQKIFELADSKFIVSALRFSTVFGGSPRLRSDIVFNNFLLNAFYNKKINIKSDGTPWRPVLHVQDACNSIIACIKAPKNIINKQAFNVGILNGNYRVKDLAEVAKKLVPESDIIYTNEHGKDSRTYKVNFKKILSVLGEYYKPKYNLETGGQELIDFFKKINVKNKEILLRKTTRLVKLKYLRNLNKINKELYFE